jgi:adenylylsulfate kinase
LNNLQEGFGIWITGLPSSGKSTISAEVIRKLQAEYDIRAVSLESDELRKILTPQPDYSIQERDWFYGVMVFIGLLLIRNGVNVLFDATANQRAYRDRARSSMKRFLEVYVKCPLDVCMSRDPKGLYRKAEEEKSGTLPGLQETYEEPLFPEVTVESDKESPEKSAHSIVSELRNRAWV